MTDPSVHELMSLMGFDGVWIDMEHHFHTMETAANLMRAIRAGTADGVLRPAKGEFMRMGRMLETGALCIFYPRCESAKEAADVVRYAKFHPLGERGVDGGGPDMPFCSMKYVDYLQMANDETTVVVQLEDPKSMKEAERMAAVPGVDGLFFGPGDMSVACGLPDQFNHPRLQKMIEQMARAARNTGKHWGMPCGSPEHVKQIIAMGGRIILHGVDLIMIKNGLEAIQRALGEQGITFERNQLGKGQSYTEKSGAQPAAAQKSRR
ncbi:MAG: hypothetical protein JNG83_09320 [Opitutaceae bacterium]|nr:hypothetical protein [Opitutaceae bacterium]